MARSPYHHGDLRRALFDALADAVLEVGPAAISLRDLARRAGVSHAAPAHHFSDKRGLLTAFAVEGYEQLDRALTAASASSGGDFTEVGVAYVHFALEHRAHFEVMFRPELLRRDDPALLEASRRTSMHLLAGTATASGAVQSADSEAAMIGAWSLVHGLATLLLDGNIPLEYGLPEALARRVARALGRAGEARTPEIPLSRVSET
jgi:AcrR family transcriptional regulator